MRRRSSLRSWVSGVSEVFHHCSMFWTTNGNENGLLVLEHFWGGAPFADAKAQGLQLISFWLVVAAEVFFSIVFVGTIYIVPKNISFMGFFKSEHICRTYEKNSRFKTNKHEFVDVVIWILDIWICHVFQRKLADFSSMSWPFPWAVRPWDSSTSSDATTSPPSSSWPLERPMPVTVSVSHRPMATVGVLYVFYCFLLKVLFEKKRTLFWTSRL